MNCLGLLCLITVNKAYNNHGTLLQVVPMYLKEIFHIRLNEYLVRDISLDQCHVDYANTYVHFNWSVTLYVLQYLRIASTGQLLRMYVPCAHLVRLTYRSMYMDTHFNRRVGSSRFKYLERTVRCVRTSLPDLQDVSS